MRLRPWSTVNKNLTDHIIYILFPRWEGYRPNFQKTQWVPPGPPESKEYFPFLDCCPSTFVADVEGAFSSFKIGIIFDAAVFFGLHC